MMRSVFYTIASLAIMLAILIVGKPVFAPLIIAFILANVLSKPVQMLNEKGMSNQLATGLVVLFAFAIVGLILAVVTTQYYGLLEDSPSFTDNLNHYKATAVDYLVTQFNLSPRFMNDIEQNIRREIGSTAKLTIGTVFESMVNFLSFILILPIFTFLLLLNRKSVKTFIVKLSRTNDNVTYQKWITSLNEIQTIVRKYISGLIIVTFILATLNTIGLLILGVPYAIILGVSAAFLSIVPYIGNIVGGGVTILVTLASTGNHKLALYIIILFGVVQLVEGNLITPKIMNNQIGVNPLVIILSLMIGGYIWGIIGMVISIPLIAIIILLFKKREGLKPFVTLLES